MDETCVVCGKPVPEGRQVCPSCEQKKGCVPDDQKTMAYLLHQSVWKESQAASQSTVCGHFPGETGKRPNISLCAMTRQARPPKAFRQFIDYLDAFFISRKEKRREES